jgi:orotidine-5'-phosphate decarboxylase
MAQQRAGLCVALDGSDRGWILDTAAALAGEADWLKIGLEAFVAHGPRLVDEVASTSGRVFLDLKLHDIPATVRRAAANVARTGAGMVTVHASGGEEMLRAAVEGVREGGGDRPVRVIAVTVLTSLDSGRLAAMGIESPVGETVLRWASLAADSGVDGVVASPLEAAAIRSRCGPEFTIVTPGVRPSWHGADDQRRTLGPAEAVAAGADLLVVGRPITRADDPVEAARRIRDEMGRGRSE